MLVWKRLESVELGRTELSAHGATLSGGGSRGPEKAFLKREPLLVMLQYFTRAACLAYQPAHGLRFALSNIRRYRTPTVY